MIKKFFPLLAVIIAYAMTSCLGNNEEEQKQSVTVKCFNKITTDEESSMSAANYLYEFDYSNGTVDVTTFDTKINATSFKITGLKLQYSNDKGYTFFAANPKVTDVQGNALSNIIVTNFYGQYCGPTIKLRYDVNGTTEVYTSPVEDYFGYSASTTESANGDLFTWEDASYDMTYNISDNTAKLTINNIKFAEKMPLTLTEMIAEGITVTPTATGLKFTAAEIIPKIGDKPYPNYKITDFEGRLSPNFSASDYFLHDQLDLTFKCMGYKVTVAANTYKQSK